MARVITALSTQDGRIAEELRAVGEKRRGDGRIVEISGEVPVGYRISLDEFREKIRLKVWERVGVANWRPFEEARAFARGLGFRNTEEWFAYCSSDKCPPDIPTTPRFVYRDRGWAGFGDWLGTGRVYRGFRPFQQARAFVRRLGLKSGAQWNVFCKSGQRPQDIPVDPAGAYRSIGWEGMGDWLGTGVVATRDRAYRPFAEARAFVRGFGLESANDWRAYCKSDKRPLDIPTNPWITYRHQGWVSVGDWLGTGTIATYRREYRPFREARAHVRWLGLKSEAEWFAYCKSGNRPPDIPTNPWVVYRDKGWVNRGDWFGTGSVANYNREFRPFREARAFVRSLGLKSQPEWFAYCRSGKCPPDIPSNPHRNYRGRGWDGYGDWLGTGSVSNRDRDFRTFREARAFVRRLALKSEAHWRIRFARASVPPWLFGMMWSQIHGPVLPHRRHAGSVRSTSARSRRQAWPYPRAAGGPALPCPQRPPGRV